MDEFPKWVNPHESHLVKKDGQITVPKFETWHRNRVNGHIDVLVNDAAGEALALAPLAMESAAKEVKIAEKQATDELAARVAATSDEVAGDDE